MKTYSFILALAFAKVGFTQGKSLGQESNFENEIMMNENEIVRVLNLLEQSEQDGLSDFDSNLVSEEALSAFLFPEDDEFGTEDDIEYPGKLTINYETVVETFRDEKLVDTYAVRGSHDVELTAEEMLSLLNADGELSLEDPEVTVMVTFTRYSDSIVMGCVILCIIIMLTLLFVDRSDEDEEDDEDDVEQCEAPEFNSSLTEPLNAKA